MTEPYRAATAPGSPDWPLVETGLRRSSRSARVGRGDDAWAAARDEVLRWGVKTRSGFRVRPLRAVAVGDRPVITAAFAVREPVEVVAVVDGPDRAGFAYRTLPGHPVRGEEAFVVHRDGDAVVLTVRSLTGPAQQQPWRALWPVLLVAQAIIHRRYPRALRRALSGATRMASSARP